MGAALLACGSALAAGRLPVGAVNAFTIPTANNQPFGVAAGPDGNVCQGDVWAQWAGQAPSYGGSAADGYRWLRDGAASAGATDHAYTPVAGDVGHVLSCEITVTYAGLDVTTAATSAGVMVLAQSAGPQGPAGPAGAEVRFGDLTTRSGRARLPTSFQPPQRLAPPAGRSCRSRPRRRRGSRCPARPLRRNRGRANRRPRPPCGCRRPQLMTGRFRATTASAQ